MANGQKNSGRIRRAASSLGNVVRNVVMRFRGGRHEVSEENGTPAPRMAHKAEGETVRRKQVAADIPLDSIASAYIPTQTGSRGGFRDDGRDRQADQEFAGGVVDERFNDEDVFTNKSGDPRIGTHRRTYEPGEREEAR